MSSKPVLPYYHSVLARLRMNAPTKNRYIIVEGKPDHEFWTWSRLLGGEKKVNIVPVMGKDNIIGNQRKGIDGLPQLFEHWDESRKGGSEPIRKCVIGIHDDDYDQILEPDSEADANLFSTKVPNDLEALLFNLWLKKGAPEFLAGRGMMEKKKLRPAIDIASTIGILRAANRKNGWGLRFKARGHGIQPWLVEAVRNRDDDDWVEGTIIPNLIKHQSKSNRRRFEKNTIAKGFSEMKRLCEDSGFDGFALVNGHDLCRIIAEMSGGEIQHEALEKALRLDRRWFKINKKTRKKFELFNRLDEWSQASGSKLFKWQ